MLAKNKISIGIMAILCFSAFGCGGIRMPACFGFSTVVVASVNGETVGLEGIPYTVRKQGEDDIVIEEKKTAYGPLHTKGAAGVSFFSEVPSVSVDYQYILVENFEELAIAQENGESPYYLVINDSSCEGCDTNYKTDVVVECEGFEPDNICDITKE